MGHVPKRPLRHHPCRRAFAKQAYGVETISFDEEDDPAEDIISATGNLGVDASIDAVGFEAKGSTVETVMANPSWREDAARRRDR